MNKQAIRPKYTEQDFVILGETPIPKIAEVIAQFETLASQRDVAGTKTRDYITLVRKHISDLDSRLNSLQQCLMRRTIQKHNIEHHTDYATINSVKNDLENEVLRYETEYIGLKARCDELDNTLQHLQQRQDVLSNTNRGLQSQINQSATQFANFQLQHDQLNAEYARCKELYTTTQAQNDEAVSRIQSLKDDIASASANLDVTKRAKNDQKLQLEKKIDDYRHKNESLLSQLDDLNKNKMKFEHETEKYKEQIAVLNTALNHNNEAYYQGEIDKLKVEIDNLLNNLSSLEEQHGDISERYKTNQNKITELNTEIATIITTRTTLEADIKLFEEKILQSELTITNHTKTLQQHEDKYNETIEKLNEQENEYKNQLSLVKATTSEKLNAKKKELGQLNVEQQSELIKIRSDYEYSLTTLTSEKERLDDSLKHYALQKVSLTRNVKQLREKISALTTTLTLKEDEHKKNQNSDSKQDEKHQMLYKLYEQERVLQLEEEKIKNKKAEMLCKMYELQQLSSESLAQEGYRRKLHNILQDLRGSIRVLSRIRPLMAHDGETEYKTLRYNPAQGEIILNLKEKDHVYNFDTILGPESTQHDVFEEVNGIVQSAIDGYNVCVFSYGQTGSGKSWTMLGDLFNDDTKGIIPRSVDLIFEQTNELRNSAHIANNMCNIELGVSCCQIYQEKIFDLLVEKKANKDEDLKIINDQVNKKIVVQGLGIKPVSSPADVYTLLELAGKNRSVAATSMNQQSSRSHFVFTLHIKITLDVTQVINNPDGTTTLKTITQNRWGLCHFSDLAGSERVSSAKTTGEQLQETKKINLSLSTLNRVFLQLSNNDKNQHISFRDSKLTELLQYCLSGDGKTMMIVNLSPTFASAQETSGSLNLAKTVSLIQKGKSKQNVFVSDPNTQVTNPSTTLNSCSGVVRKQPNVPGSIASSMGIKRQKQ